MILKLADRSGYLAMDVATDHKRWIHFNEAALTDEYFFGFLANPMQFFFSNLVPVQFLLFGSF